jgi:DNA-binding CsgD family transcriptional regulator
MTAFADSMATDWCRFAELGAVFGAVHDCRSATVLFSNYPKELDALYERDFGIRRDPVMRAAMQASSPVKLKEYLRANDCPPPFLRLVSAASEVGAIDAVGIFVTPRVGDFMYFALGFAHSLEGSSEKLIPRIQRCAEMAARRLTAVDGGSPVRRLTKREIEVLCLFSGGRSDKEIARELGLAPCTVRTLAERCAEKLNVASRIESAIEATRLGIIPPL